MRALQRAGFSIVRQAGSHVILRGPNGAIANVPMHTRRDVPPGTLRAILAAAKLTPDALRRFL
ncbi:MAG: type II toxin-antitoxin system HicA family toxin [Candidatus Baltobacteraceae bacterium]